MGKQIVSVFNRKVDLSTPFGRKAYEILRYCEVFQESAHIIDTSNKVSTVLDRIRVYEDTLFYLSNCFAGDLKKCGLTTPEHFREIYEKWMSDKKVNIINKAILRETNATIEHAKTLKTERGIYNCMNRHFNALEELQGLRPENVAFIKQLKNEWVLSKNASE